MGRGVWVAMIGLAAGLAGCAIAVSNTEGLLSQAGFKMIPADTPKRVQHLQTLRPHTLIKRTGDGAPYYVYADPDHCKCMYVGSESAYATYKSLVKQQDAAMALREEREEEDVQGDK